MAKNRIRNSDDRRVVYFSLLSFSLLSFSLLLLLSLVKTSEISCLGHLGLKNIDILAQLIDTTSFKKQNRPNISEIDLALNEQKIGQYLHLVDTLKISSDTIRRVLNTKYHLYDFSENADLSVRLSANLSLAESHKGLLRVAFLGDSFIEGDIITGDVRSLLQNRFRGKGVGYIPIVSVAGGFSKNVIHNFHGWVPHSITDVDKKELKSHLLTFTGNYFEAIEGAFFSATLRSKKDTFSVVNQSKLLYISNGKTVITPIVNGNVQPSFSTNPSPKMQSFDLNGNIRSVKYIFQNVTGFTAYGVYMSDTIGVWVDNYSVRGSAGTGLFPNQGTIHSEFNKLLPYAIIVLQYGLNINEANRTDYSGYKKRMVKVISRLKIEHPQSICILMSVGDRAHKSGDSFETMPSIHAMIATQKQIAKEAGIMFWNTYEAMGGQNSMVAFVEHNPPLAAKDYTHINHTGGRIIAKAFVRALFSLIDEPISTDQVYE